MTIGLGQKVKDTLTEFEGIVVARTVYLNGCIRVAVQPQVLKDGLPQDFVWIDETQLSVVAESTVEAAAEGPSGPRPDALRAPNPIRR